MPLRLKRTLPGIVTLLALLGSACTTVGPDFETPEAPLPKQWKKGGAEAARAPAPATERWWTLFRDPVLDRLVAIARDQNLDLQIAGLRVLEARAQLGIVTGSLYPQLQTVSGNYSFNRGRKTPLASRHFSQAGAGFDAAWELDFWGKFRRGIESADANLVANIAGYDDVLITLTAEVARNYVLIRTLEERIRLARANIAIQRRSLELTTNQFETGAVTELDMQQATTQLRDTEALVPNLLISLDQARHALSILLAMPPQDLEELLAGSSGIPTPPAEVATGIPADLLRRRPDIKRAELQAAAQSAQVGVAEAELLPSFSLFGSIGWNVNDAGEDDLGDLFDSGSLHFSTGPSFQWKILNYGRLKNQVRVQDARLQQLLANYENTVLNAAAEVKNAISSFEHSRVEAEYRRKSAAAARRSADLAMLQYTEGVTLYQSVLDATRALASQEDAWAVTRGNIATSLIALYKALGGGWEVHMGRDFVPPAVREQMRRRTDWGRLLDETRNEEGVRTTGGQRPTRPDW
ncbi:MAG TPA: efflux transporter outer membrane subunit [Gammaproteobacteria bacterium]|nr:efflux transporter outer membrane subunit [Gammaproteobacteria bacterium]